MDNAARIAQFENMTQADPTNEMAHFSLGRAYAEAGRHADAARAYLRCIELVPDMSKAYQLAGESLVKAGDADRAKSVLRQGHTIAAGKGDFMPRSAMAKMLADLGEPVADAPAPGAPAAGTSDDGGPVPDGMIRCRQSGRVGTRMARPPFRGRLGDWIFANISKETFDAWIRQGTKVINEMRLDLSRERDQEVYDQHMREFLGVDEKDLV